MNRIVNIAEREGFDIYDKLFLIVDEWHMLFTSLDYRQDSIDALLNQAKRFKRATFMSATPIEDAFMLEELMGMDRVEII